VGHSKFNIPCASVQLFFNFLREVVQPGRIRGLGPRGRRFESCPPDFARQSSETSERRRAYYLIQHADCGWGFIGCRPINMDHFINYYLPILLLKNKLKPQFFLQNRTQSKAKFPMHSNIVSERIFKSRPRVALRTYSASQ
jgi:hypothetical protein